MKITNYLRSFSFTGLSLITCWTVEEAAAQRPRPKPKPPAPPAAPVVSVLRARPDVMELQATYIPGYTIEHQVVGGPGTTGSLSSLTIGPFFMVGTLDFRNVYAVILQPDTEYTIRVRQIKTSVDFSAWTTFKFRTAATFLARPMPPRNLRETVRTASTVTLVWDAPSTGPPMLYEYFIDGVKMALTRCSGSLYVPCREADLRTVTFALPSVAGSSLVFGVAARDTDLNLSTATTLTITK